MVCMGNMKNLVDPKDVSVTIYGHRDRDTGEYRYVGATTNLKRRWHGNLMNEVVVLEVTTLDRQVEREHYWIKRIRDEGNPLANSLNPLPIYSVHVKSRHIPPRITAAKDVTAVVDEKKNEPVVRRRTPEEKHALEREYFQEWYAQNPDPDGD